MPPGGPAIIDLTGIRQAALVVLNWADRPHDRLANDWTKLARALNTLAALPHSRGRLGRAIAALTGDHDPAEDDLRAALCDLADAVGLPRPSCTHRADQLSLDL
jgi:hypothetical protein